MPPVCYSDSKALLSVQVCDAAEIQADDEGSSSLTDRQPSLAETISDAELESLKVMSGGIAIMMVRARTHHTLTERTEHAVRLH